ncbi:MAG: Uma2 family endonuclease [Pirellulales bacterium]|nr:Uma2 family endonuclease [Pirellulales bacterium]
MAAQGEMAVDMPTDSAGFVIGLTMTEDEFVVWADKDVSAEWVDGRVVMMSPANDEHNALNIWLLGVLQFFVEHHDLGIVRGPEFAIRLASQRRRRVPDVLYLASERLDLLTTNHIEGAPDLAIELVSPDSESRDWREKYQEYEIAGVREYWVIDPMSRHAEFYQLDAGGKYVPIEPVDGKLHSVVLPGFWIKIDWLWPETRPKMLEAFREIGVL